MILIADSGSTKTDWCLLSKYESIFFHSKGLNPYFVDSKEVSEVLREVFPQKYSFKDISKIYFYGAGCKSIESQSIIKKGLKAICSKTEITVDSDLIGAAIAMYGNESGMISIIGTGMSLGFWDGKEICISVPSLGYILGDQGSGAFIGKIFLQLLFENKISESVVSDFNKTFQIDLFHLLENVYKKPYPNRYLASFVPFVYKHKNDTTIHIMLEKIFSDFAQLVVYLSQKSNCKRISAIGSVAYFYKDFIQLELNKNGITIDKIEATPIEKLCSFYNKQI
jgi:glucosamine kinase